MQYSASSNAWYENDSTYAPEDAVGVPDELYRQLVGKALKAGPDGMPILGGVDLPSMEQQIEFAEQKRVRLLAEAAVYIAPLQDAVDLGEATDEEEACLIAWKKYRVLLMRIDTSTAPDITWPEKPAS